MTDLMSMELHELETLMADMGEPKFRARQVYSWLCRGVAPADMTNVSKTLRERLSVYPTGSAEIYDKWVSAIDGTIKYLFKLEDGNLVEGVFMRYHHGNTVCISTQVGCRMGCAFCASTLNGKVRDLTAGEMQSFIALVESDVPTDEGRKRTVTNIVLMGSGEPLDNYDNVVKFLRLISNPDGMNISPRNISLSTSGLVPQLLRFMEEAPHVTLSVSLHAPNDAVRDTLMPVNKSYPMAELLAAAKKYADTTGRRVIFEYALIDGVNASETNADELSKRLRGINCHVNLIPLNHVKERNLNGVTRAYAEKFREWLLARKISATVRREMGSDIDGACGQLRNRVLDEIKRREEEK